MHSLNNDTLERRLRVLQMITASFLMTPVILSVVALQVPLPETSGLDEMVMNILGGVAGLNLLASLAVPTFLLGKKTQASKSAPHAPRKEVVEIFPRYFMSVIIGHALRESAVILGFVISFLTGDMNWLYGLGAAFVVLTILSWPKLSALEPYR